MSSWGMPDMQRYAPPPHQQQHNASSSRSRPVFQQGPGHTQGHPDVSAGGYRMDQMSSHDGSYLGGGSNGNPFGDHSVGRNTMNVMSMDNPNQQAPTTAQTIGPSHSQAPQTSATSQQQQQHQQQQQQQASSSQANPSMQGHESPNPASAHLRPSLQTQLDALLKTQTDVITYLQVELERRRDWEDRMNKELQQRHAVLLTLLTQLMPVSAGGLNSAAVNFAAPPPGPGAPARTAEILSRNLQNPGNGAPASVAMTNDLSHGPLPMPGTSKQKTPAIGHPDALLAHLPPGMGGGPRLSASSLPHLLDGSGRPYHTDPTFGGFGLHDRGLANGHDMVNGGYAPDGEDGFGGLNAASGRMSAKPQSAKVSKRKRREGSGSSDEGRGGVEVDERGVIYMANGKKTDSRPAKIQSLVRKSIQAGMGMTNGKRHIPSLEEDPLQPGEEWRFGNLRFDWDKTPRQSSHNAHLKEIVLNHIMKSRGEYPSIPDADFTPTRLDHSFGQAFTTWRGKFKSKDRRDVRNVSVDVEG